MTTEEMTEETTAVQAFDSGLNNEKHNYLVSQFNSFGEGLQDLIDKGDAITIADESDIASMTEAREIRLELRRVRIDVEHKRKELKENALREGKAIDGMANILKFLIEPAEKALQEKEDFVKSAEEKRIAELVEQRAGALTPFGIDPTAFNLADMTDEAFETLRSTSEAGHKAKVEAEQREQERIKAEREAEEKRLAEEARQEKERREKAEAENAKLRAENEAAEREKKEAQAEAERIRKEAEEKERLERVRQMDLERKANEAELERVRAEREAEQARIKAEEDAKQKALQAPDKDKLKALEENICSLAIPNVSSTAAMDAVQVVRDRLNGCVRTIRAAIKKIEGDA